MRVEGCGVCASSLPLYVGRDWFAYPEARRYDSLTAGLEAALAGCALVLGDVPTLRELWDGSARFAPPGDDEALHGALAALTARPRDCGPLAGKARRRALALTPDAAADRYLLAYREAAGRPAGLPQQWAAPGPGASQP